MKITPNVALELAHHEGLVREAYKDSVGVWTWSIGITNASGHSVERYINKPQSYEHCIGVYAWALRNYAEDVLKAFSGFELTEAQFAAAVSFHYNTGGIFRASWAKHWRAGRHEKARKAFMNWNKPAEIISRRQAECDLFFDGVWKNDGTVPVYEVDREAYQPIWGSRQNVNMRKLFDRVIGPEKPPQPDMEQLPEVDTETRPRGLNKLWRLLWRR